MPLPDAIAALPVVTINLEYGDSDHQLCRDSPAALYKQFRGPNTSYPGYGFLELNVSIRVLPDDLEADWFGTPESYWMRQKIRRAIKLGYEFGAFEHNDHIDELHDINTSLDQRQGRPMSQVYRDRPPVRTVPSDQPCPRHRDEYFGVFKDGRLYAYTQLLQCGEMMLFSKILGHGDQMADGIMNLLVYDAAKLRKAESGTAYAIYFLQHSGTQGLQFFKRKMGFEPYRVQWELARPGVVVPDDVLAEITPATAPGLAASGGERPWWRLGRVRTR